MAFGPIFPELKLAAPDGVVVDVTVWFATSLLVHVTFPPFATVTLAGWKLSDWSPPTPFGIDTLADDGTPRLPVDVLNRFVPLTSW